MDQPDLERSQDVGDEIERLPEARPHRALIRAGSGLVVGVADLVDSLMSLDTLGAYAATEALHAVAPTEQKAAYEGGWRTLWVISGARALSAPVRYRHPSGAVTWVLLDPAVVQAIQDQIGTGPREELDKSVGISRSEKLMATAISKSSVEADRTVVVRGESRVVRVTGGNVRNGHIYVPLEFFPLDAIGGANKSEAAPRPVRVSFVPGQTTETDVDGTKRILRERGAVRDFFFRAELRENDSIVIENTASYTYRFSKA